ncbi:mitochondrial ribosome recycling factor 2 isoform X2 [Brevipalpus obovatus]|uniref:mitochondrial ribosome recycling factor 2 isoform X2 n=1 Tax=Brevipalpus obovatus TaxID=246614 RepID=UPI003D9E346C
MSECLGFCLILDSTAGVEAQTNTVWQQAERYNIPKIVFLNKMDKPANDVDKCIKSLEALECIPVPIQLPLFRDNKFIGIYDVISLSRWKWEVDPIKQGLEYDVKEVTTKHEKYETLIQKREDLISHLADLDDQMSELVLNNDSLMNIDSAEIMNSLRRCVIKNQIVPVLLGSSYRNIGVQPLMDAILRYLPSPIEKPNPIATYYKGNFCASAFKVIHHKNLGPLTFIRVFSGRITPQEKVYNLNRDTTEKISKIYLPMADDFHEINVASLGHIVAVSGLTSSVTSDTLTSSKTAADEARACFAREKSLPVEESSPVLASINVPEPVFFCTIEAPSMSKQKELDIALAKLQREDPSLRVTYDTNTDQTILSGMGELHLEVIRERIRRDFNIDVSMGKLRVSYREYPKDTMEGTMSKEKNFGGVKNHVTINLRLRPSDSFESKFKLKVIVDQDNDLGKLRADRLRAIKHGVDMALNFGPLASFPVHGVDVDLLDFKCTSATLHSFISSVTSECVAHLLRKGGISLLEPIMQVQVICPEVYYSRVLNDLIARRGQLISMTAQKNSKIITFLVPLIELVSYSTFLRTITSGNAFFTMQIDCYRKLSDSEQTEAMEKMFSL